MGKLMAGIFLAWLIGIFALFRLWHINHWAAVAVALVATASLIRGLNTPVLIITIYVFFGAGVSVPILHGVVQAYHSGTAGLLTGISWAGLLAGSGIFVFSIGMFARVFQEDFTSS